MSAPNTKPGVEYDPVYLHSLRETFVIIALFAVFCFWSLYVCYNYGYLQPGEERADIKLVLGMPSWAFWGLALPWVLVDVVALWFCFFFMKADDLGEGEDLDGQVARRDDEKEAGHE